MGIKLNKYIQNLIIESNFILVLFEKEKNLIVHAFMIFQ